MKILNVNMSLDPVTGGGTAERTFQISRFLVKAGAECTVLTTDLGSWHERVRSMDGVTVVALPCLLKRFYFPKFSYRLMKDIVTDADVIQMMCHWTLINTIVYLFAKRFDKPLVVCPAGALPLFGRSRILKRIYNLSIGKKIIGDADGHIAITADEISQFQAYGVDANSVVVIPNGINDEDFIENNTADFRQKYGLGDAPFILFVGRLNYIKGPDLLLTAFCNLKDQLQDFRLVFGGPDGGMLAELEQIAADVGVSDRVHFIGYLGGADKSQAYHAANLLVIPSRQEAMSIVALEAGATGTPVLLTDQCGFEAIDKIGGGKVVPASVNGLQQGLVEMLGDPLQLKAMGTNLKRYTSDHFTWESAVEKYLTLYSQILSKKNKRTVY